MATVMKQGEDYEEDDVLEDYDDEGGEDTDSKLTSLFGIPVKFLVIGGAVLLLLLIGVVVFALRGGKEEEIVPPEITDPNPVVQDTPVVDNTATNTVDQSTVAQDVIWFDAQGNIAGFTKGTEEGTEVLMNDQPIGTLSMVSGTPVTSDSGLSAYINSSGSGNVTFNNTSTDITDVVTELRKLGYTGDEIAAAQSSGADLNAMIESAQKLRDEEAKEALIRMSDSASEEFQHIVNQSIFCLPEISFPQVENTPDRVIRDGNYTVNADYEKLDLRGNQLYIKLKIANDTYAFMTLTPQRWEALPETGNMVVRVEYTLYGMNATGVQFFIKNINELDVSQITVNPEDSATDLGDIVDLGAATEDTPE